MYRFLNKNNKIIYVGKTYDLSHRMSGHKTIKLEDKDIKIHMYKQIYKIEYCELDSDYLMNIYEIHYIAQLNPFFNKEFKTETINLLNIPDLRWELYVFPSFLHYLAIKHDNLPSTGIEIRNKMNSDVNFYSSIVKFYLDSNYVFKYFMGNMNEFDITRDNEKRCIKCNKKFIYKSNSHIYCKKCSKKRNVNAQKDKTKNKSKKELNYTYSQKVKDEKDRFASIYKEKIIELYINKKLSFYRISEILKIKRLNPETIRHYIILWNIPVRNQNNQHFQEKYINFIGAYNKNNHLVEVFKYKHEVRKWIVDNKLCEVSNFPSGRLNSLIKNKLKLKGYLFKYINEEIYNKYVNGRN
ncbi:GIY-YIG nuclease family protein [Niallia alba]|nr:GIY-YIG nuclease family protein [Niallia alba]